MVLGLEMEVQAMETQTRWYTMEVQTKAHIRPHCLRALESDVTLLAPAVVPRFHLLPVVRTTFGAVTNDRDAMDKLRSARTCERPVCTTGRRSGSLRTRAADSKPTLEPVRCLWTMRETHSAT